MSAPPHSKLPELQPPGAGLPTVELWIARLLFHGGRHFASPATMAGRVKREHEKIRALVLSCDHDAAAQRVLIPRLRGIEDSSRFWSVWMTLDHLRIVNEAVVRTIPALLEGREPSGKAEIAAVKPSPEANHQVLAAFDASCVALQRAGTEVHSLASGATYRHPWFGRLDAAGWKFLGGVHLALHRRQIIAILRGLGVERAEA